MATVKNKKLTYILLPVVLLIWAVVILQLVDFTKPKELSYASDSAQVIKSKQILTDTLRLNLAYSDPFLGRSLIRFEQSQSSLPKPLTVPLSSSVSYSPPKTTIEPVKIIWPRLKYGGTINKNALLKVNNSQYILNVGEEVEGLKVLQIQEDSLRLSYKNEKKTIFKK